MASATSQTVTYSTIAALALDKLSEEIADTISTANAAFYFMKKSGNWEGVTAGGRQLRKSVLYNLQTIRPLGAFGVVNVNPVDSHTSTYWPWVQTAVAVSFADLEEFQTGGSEAIETIVKAKFQQATASLDDFMDRAILRGQADIDGSSVTTEITSPSDGSLFVVPIAKLVHYLTSTSLTVGGIDQSTNAFWKNQYLASTATSLTAWLGELRNLHIYCQRGGGNPKAPDFHLTDEYTYNCYERGLSLLHRNPNYERADIPFENVLFKKAPVIPDQLMIDAYSGSTTLSYGTWYMLNSGYMGFTYDKTKSFKLGDYVRPANQLVSTALMPVRGALWTNNRRKLGVNHTIASTAGAALQTATS